MACILCGRGIPGCDCDTKSPVAVLKDIVEEIEGEPKKLGRPAKPDDEIGKSAGRKRAGHAIEEKLRNRNLCEWAGKANAGGGKHPIVGCINNKATHVHHGPDKDTSNNNPGNIHNICTTDHNRWHSANDSDYDGNIPHEPRDATAEELLLALHGSYISESS